MNQQNTKTKTETASAPETRTGGANDYYFEQLHEADHFVPEDGETDASRNL